MAKFNLKPKKPLERKDMNQLIGRLFVDPQFKQEFLSNPEETVAHAGLNLTKWEVKEAIELFANKDV